MTSAFGPPEAARLLAGVFAPWVCALNLQPLAFDEAGGDFLLPANADLTLNGGPGKGVICGQATAAIADTVSVLTLSAANGRFRTLTTTDMSCTFLRPLMLGDVAVRVHILSNGRKTAACRTELRQHGKEKLAMTANCTFLYLEA